MHGAEAMIAQSIRCQNDLELSKKLLEHPEVIQVKETIARMEGKKKWASEDVCCHLLCV